MAQQSARMESERVAAGYPGAPPIEETAARVSGAAFRPTARSTRTAAPLMYTNQYWVIGMLIMGMRLFLQLNGYLLLAVLIAGAIKVLLPTALITQWVGGTALNSVPVACVVAVLAYVCTYVEVPTALALMSKGMGPGATLAYLLGGPGLSLPSIAMLSGIFRPRVLALYVGVSFVGCVIAGSIYNLFV